MTFEEAAQKALEFRKERDWEQFHTPENLAKSISIEAAELLECFQWSDTEFDKEHLCEELADVMNYCLQLADVIGVDPDEIINAKCAQNEAKYPVEKAKGKSDKYTAYADKEEE